MRSQSTTEAAAVTEDGKFALPAAGRPTGAQADPMSNRKESAITRSKCRLARRMAWFSVFAALAAAYRKIRPLPIGAICVTSLSAGPDHSRAVYGLILWPLAGWSSRKKRHPAVLVSAIVFALLSSPQHLTNSGQALARDRAFSDSPMAASNAEASARGGL
jgi:hypothetical protein